MPRPTRDGPPEAPAPRSPRRIATRDVPDDARLVDRARGGDRWAEEALYRRHVRYVYGVAARLLRNRAEAEDVVQETFAIALERLDSLREGGAVRGWLAQIAVSQVRRYHRRRRLRSLLGIDIGVDDATLAMYASSAAGPDVRSDLAALDRVLATLPFEQRAAWMIRHVEGESLEDTARACGCSLATIKRRLAAAGAKVSEHVGPEWGER